MYRTYTAVYEAALLRGTGRKNKWLCLSLLWLTGCAVDRPPCVSGGLPHESWKARRGVCDELGAGPAQPEQPVPSHHPSTMPVPHGQPRQRRQAPAGRRGEEGMYAAWWCGAPGAMAPLIFSGRPASD